jgi:imidazolonepropionase-like amidohydrolase
VGKRADLVLLAADPLADIRNTRKIDRVVHGGQVCDPAVLLSLVPTH